MREHCKLPQWSLGRNQVLCILAWKCDTWWHQIYWFFWESVDNSAKSTAKFGGVIMICRGLCPPPPRTQRGTATGCVRRRSLGCCSCETQSIHTASRCGAQHTRNESVPRITISSAVNFFVETAIGFLLIYTALFTRMYTGREHRYKQ